MFMQDVNTSAWCNSYARAVVISIFHFYFPYQRTMIITRFPYAITAIVIVGTHETRCIFQSELPRRKRLTPLYSRFISSSMIAQFAQQTTSFLADETIRRSNRKSLRSWAPDIVIVLVAIINVPPASSLFSPSRRTILGWFLRYSSR